MIDFRSVKTQLQEYLTRRLESIHSIEERLQRMVTLYRHCCEHRAQWSEVLRRVGRKWSGRKPSLLIAGIDEHAPSPSPSRSEDKAIYTCFATDGSQILPSRHEIAGLGLIQIGEVAVAYRQEIAPAMDFHSKLVTEETLESASLPPMELPRFDVRVTDERGLLEFEALVALAERFEGVASRLALVDGTLIFWNLEDRSPAWRKSQMARLSAAFDRLRSCATPVAGYISRPGSREVIHALAIYDFEQRRRCLPEHPADLFIDPVSGENSDFAPGITDRMLFDRILKAGQRSAWADSGSHILSEYPQAHRIRFCYLRTAWETVRLEIPTWAERFSDALVRFVLDQCRKGQGYPITLSEAHELAVIRGADREVFYRLVGEQWRRIQKNRGIKTPPPDRSPKQKRKVRPLF